MESLAFISVFSCYTVPKTKRFAGEGRSGVRGDQGFAGLTGAAQQEATPDGRGGSAAGESKRFQCSSFYLCSELNRNRS